MIFLHFQYFDVTARIYGTLSPQGLCQRNEGLVVKCRTHPLRLTTVIDLALFFFGLFLLDEVNDA